MTAIAWFRRDLRLDDNPALAAALADGNDDGGVVPLFVRDPALNDPGRIAPARLAYLDAGLADLDAWLRAVGGRLVIRDGRPEDVVPAVAREVDASSVHAAREVTPYARARDEAVNRLVPLTLHPGQLLTEPETIGGQRVFAAFHRRWVVIALRDPIESPGRVHVRDGLAGAAIPRRARGSGGIADPMERARAFAVERASSYGAQRDRLDLDATSHLSSDLHFGTISPRRLTDIVTDAAYRRQLAWRDWAHHLLWWRPEAARTAWQLALTTVPWRQDAGDLAAWQEGRTGFPAVDAAMRQLAETGWIANRARLIAASFLTKELSIDWRIGARHFMRTLVDGDVANNACNWQWMAGVGTDSAPYFRILSPTLQGQRFDPHGSWARRWLPELRHVPDAFIHRPWDAPGGPPAGYPPRMVDRSLARERALSTYRAARFGTPPASPNPGAVMPASDRG